MALLRGTGLSPKRVLAGCIGAIATMFATNCTNLPGQLTQLVEARRLASDLRVQFSRAADAANRAVMAGTDEAAASAAREAEDARQAVQRDVEQLQPMLQSLDYRDEMRHLNEFRSHFEEYRMLDGEILTLAVENSNLKAQRLSFGPARAAREAFRGALEAAVRMAASSNEERVDALAARAGASLLEIEVIQASHIAEPDDAAMSRMEAEMAVSEAAARSALERLRELLPPPAAPQLAAAAAALDRFRMTNAEIVALSRRNSNVRALALTLGRKRTLTALCEDTLRALEEALATHSFTATR